MKNVTLKQLRYFEALVRHGHFGRAATDCGISQPALSVQIKELEASLGSPLFERSARQVSLTGLGEEFASRVRTILRSMDELEDLARMRASNPLGRLRLGVIPTIAPYLLPSVVDDLQQAYPGLDLRIREALTPRLIVELLEGRLDTAIVALPISEPSFTEFELFQEEFVLVRNRSDANRPVPDPEQLAEMKLLLLEEGHCFRDQALSFCAARGVRPRELMEGNSLGTLVQLVGAGIGITLIPDMAVEIETRSAAVSIARFPDPPPTRKIGVIWRRSSPLSGQLVEIAQLIRRSVVEPG